MLNKLICMNFKLFQNSICKLINTFKTFNIHTFNLLIV